MGFGRDIEFGCPNPKCPDLEVERDEDSGVVEAVIVRTWSEHEVPATRIDPAYLDGDAECPSCHEPGEEPDRAEDAVLDALREGAT